MTGERILIVEDSMIVSTHIRAVLTQEGYEIQNVVTSAEDAINEVELQKPDLILMDIVLAGELDGIQASRIIQETNRIPVIYLTAMTDQRTYESAKLTGPYSYVIKPFDERDLLTRIELVLYKSKLEKENERKRIAAIIEGQEIERQRVSRELHDGLGQLLMAIRINIDDDGFSSCGELKRQTADLIYEAVDEIRRISENLMPRKLVNFDLRSCLKSLCNQSSTDRVRIIFQTQSESVHVTDLQKLMLYRIAQECLNNAIKHGNCSKIFVQLYGDQQSVSLSIEDDGKGFDTLEATGGNGLKNIRDRADIMQGSVNIHSDLEKGTLISILIPLKI